MAKRRGITWTVLEEHENESFILVFKHHSDPDAEIKPWRITCARKGGEAEHEDFSHEDRAREHLNHYLEVLGFAETVILPPETPEELWATYIMRAKQVKTDGEALSRLEDEFEADPKVHEWIEQLLVVARGPTQKSWAALSFRRGLEEIETRVLRERAEAAAKDLEALAAVPNFGRFGF